MLLGASAALIKGHTEKTHATERWFTSLGFCKWHCQSPQPEWVRCAVIPVIAAGLWSSAWVSEVRCYSNHSNRTLVVRPLEQACSLQGWQPSRALVWKWKCGLCFDWSEQHSRSILLFVPAWHSDILLRNKTNRLCHFHERTFCIKWAFRISSIYAVVCQDGIFLQV